jgi:hypothetical protein
MLCTIFRLENTRACCQYRGFIAVLGQFAISIQPSILLLLACCQDLNSSDIASVCDFRITGLCVVWPPWFATPITGPRSMMFIRRGPVGPHSTPETGSLVRLQRKPPSSLGSI